MLQDLPSILKGGTEVTIEFSSRETSVLGVDHQLIEFSEDNGQTFTLLEKISGSERSYVWTVPLITVKKAIIRITAVDRLHYQSSSSSPSFEIRSRPPIFSQDVSPASVVNNLSSISYGGDCEEDFPVIIFKKNTAGALDRVGDAPCINSRWAFSFSVTADSVNELTFSETDPVGNHAEVGAVWTRDTVAPTLTQTLVVSPVTTNLNSVTFGGACETGLKVKGVLLSAPGTNLGEVNCTGAQWSFTVSATTDASRTYTFSQVDAANNSRSLNVVWIRDTVAPNLTQDVAPNNSASNAASLALGGACENGFNVILNYTDAAGAAKQNTIGCANSRWATSFAPGADYAYNLVLSQTDRAQNKRAVPVVWLRDTTAPQILAGSLKLKGGAASVNNNYLPVSLNGSDALSNITHFCLVYQTDAQVASVPNEDCWTAVNNPEQPNLPVQKTLALVNFLYRIGYVRGTYYVDAWLKDAVGNISVPMRAMTFYDPGTPPVVINVIASRTDSPSFPLSAADMNIPEGSPVYIRWKVAASAIGLDTGPIAISYTVDDRNYVEVQSGLSDAQNGSCSLLNGLASGCFVWSSTRPSDSYFRIRVSVKDKNGMITTVSSNPLNGGELSSLAGNTDSGVGASAPAAMFISVRKGYIHPDLGTLVVMRDGRIFFRDHERGILSVSAGDGVVKVLLPLGSSNNYEGAVPNSAALVMAPIKIALDYTDGLLIFDYDRIRRLDLKTMVIETVIGTGSSTADGVGPKNVQITPLSSYGSYVSSALSLVPLPNGNIIFQSDNYNNENGRLRVYSKANDSVGSIYVSGSGHGPSNASEPNYATEDLATCYTVILGVNTPCVKVSFGVEFDSVTSSLTVLQVMLGHRVVGNMLEPIANLEPSGPNIGRSLAPHPNPEGSLDSSYYRVTGRNGKLYSLNRREGRISRFDKPTNSWVKVVGAAGIGTCEDGTPALQCAIHPSDAFVDAQSNIFFLDRGRIRTVDGAGKVITVYGQSFYFGDGGLAISARFNSIPTIDRINDGRVVILDNGESRLREFSPGSTIRTIAGNGQVSVYPNYTDPASTQPMNWASAGVEDIIFSVNRTNGDVYSSNNPVTIMRLDRSTDRWVKITDKLGVGARAGYIPNVLGFDGSRLLVHQNGFDSAINAQVDAVFRSLDLAGNITPVAGVLGTTTAGDICAAGTAQNQCVLPTARANNVTKAQYDSAGQRWIVAGYNRKDFQTMSNDSSAPVGHLATSATAATSFAYVRYSDGTGDLFYCAIQGRLRKVNPITGVDTILPWRIASMECTGYALIYDPQKHALIFPYIQNGLYGVGQYQLPQ